MNNLKALDNEGFCSLTLRDNSKFDVINRLKLNYNSTTINPQVLYLVIINEYLVRNKIKRKASLYEFHQSKYNNDTISGFLIIKYMFNYYKQYREYFLDHFNFNDNEYLNRIFDNKESANLYLKYIKDKFKINTSDNIKYTKFKPASIKPTMD